MSLPAASRLFRSALRTQLRPAANITTKPPKEVLGAGELAIGLGALFAAILVPSSWILAHIEDYKKQE